MSVKTVLITGSNRGIGLQFATHYAQQGWNVIAGVRNPSSAEELNALAVKVIELDTSDEKSITNAASHLRGEPIDLLINNAGIGTGGGIDKTTKEDLMQQFEINAVGPFLVTRALLPNLKQAVALRGSAVVGQVSSRMGSIDDNGSGGMYGYRASKAALNMINASLAKDLKNEKILTVALHPGYVATRMTGGNGAINTETSVAGLTKILDNLKAEDSGKFISWDGSVVPW